MKLIQLSRGLKAMVDDKDYNHLNQFKWCARADANGNMYTMAKSKGVYLSMHSLLLGSKSGFVIDHADGDGLNNQRSNLRFLSRSHNGLNCKGRSRNKTNCIGVYLSKSIKNGKTYSYYIANISIDGKRKQLGCFKKLTDAKKARIDAEKKYLNGVIVNSRDIKTFAKPDLPILKRFYGGVSGIRGVFRKDKKWFGRFAKSGVYHTTNSYHEIESVVKEYKKMYKKVFGFNSPYHK
jgi:hypothetical protein